jgi:hypothetical protein
MWDFTAPDIEVMIAILSLAIALRFGEDKGKKAKELLNSLKIRYGKN